MRILVKACCWLVGQAAGLATLVGTQSLANSILGVAAALAFACVVCACVVTTLINVTVGPSSSARAPKRRSTQAVGLR